MNAPLPEPDTFLSGESGQVSGPRLTIRATLADAALDLRAALARYESRLDRLASATPPRRVLVLSVYRPHSRLPGSRDALRSEHHDVSLAFGAVAPEPDAALAGDTALTGLGGGKFENLNLLLDRAGPGADWLVVADDDVQLPARFLDRFIALCERLRLDLAQPAQTRRSHAAWRVTRRRADVARLTRFVEIGPVTAFSRRAATELLPFPGLRFGWGLDNHWAALARERGWRSGIVDALPVRHEWQPVAASYTHAEAIDEARRFLAGRPYLTTAEAQQTLQTFGRVPQ